MDEEPTPVQFALLLQDVRQMIDTQKQHNRILFGADGDDGIVSDVRDLKAFVANLKAVGTPLAITTFLAALFFVAAVLTDRVEILFR